MLSVPTQRCPLDSLFRINSCYTGIASLYHVRPIGASRFSQSFTPPLWQATPGFYALTNVLLVHFCDLELREMSNSLLPRVISARETTMKRSDLWPLTASSGSSRPPKVVVDRLTKYGHFIPLTHPFTAAKISDIFIKEIFRLHGMPKTIVSDRDPVFISNFWDSFFTAQVTQLCRSSSYHPQSDGQTEVLNRTLEHYLRCFVDDKPSTWVHWLLWAEWWYNTTFQAAIKMSPYQALYGVPPPSVPQYLQDTSLVQAVDQTL
ncbi:hypothetical protein GBA52_014680 [Prunus armeniaca]|nr:hypothetical protein GBA52_014680 [Prunus armeniaca]